jgi:mono/diheme cytochrome c family protein
MEGKMMNRWKSILGPGLLWIAALPLISQANSAASGPPETSKPRNSSPASLVHQSIGERKFAQNCSRCHTSPEGFSPHIAGTIIRHMRVRASLSKQDEDDIMHFLNP